MHTPQAGTVSTSLTVGTSKVEEMLCARMTNTIVLPYGALITKNEADRSMVSKLSGIGLNVVMLPREMLYVLHDGITTELRAREGRVLQVISEQLINMQQLSF